MFTFLFVIMMCAIFGNLFVFALKAAWGIGKLVFYFAFLPLIIIGMMIAGIAYVAVPLLVIIGIVSLVKMFAANN